MTGFKKRARCFADFSGRMTFLNLLGIETKLVFFMSLIRKLSCKIHHEYKKHNPVTPAVSCSALFERMHFHLLKEELHLEVNFTPSLFKFPTPRKI